MTVYSAGDWVQYRRRGMGREAKILERRPDGKLVVGQHDNDPNPTTIDVDDVTGRVE